MQSNTVASPTAESLFNVNIDPMAFNVDSLRQLEEGLAAIAHEELERAVKMLTPIMDDESEDLQRRKNAAVLLVFIHDQFILNAINEVGTFFKTYHERKDLWEARFGVLLDPHGLLPAFFPRTFSADTVLPQLIAAAQRPTVTDESVRRAVGDRKVARVEA